MIDSIYLLIPTILFSHFIADFLMQSNKVAINRSKDFFVLYYHVLIYSISIFFVMMLCFYLMSSNFNFVPTLNLLFQWAFINFIFHFAIDFFTSKICSYFWKKKKIHYFFVTIGADQFFHTSILIVSFFILNNLLI